MSELPELARYALAALAVLLLFAFAWSATRPMPKLARGLARLCIVALTVLPIALIVLTSDLGVPAPGAVATAPQTAPAPIPVPEAQPAPEAAKPAPPPKKAAEAKPAEPTAEAPPVVVGEAAPEDEVVAESAPEPSGGAGPPADIPSITEAPSSSSSQEIDPMDIPGRGRGGSNGATAPPPPPPPAPAPATDTAAEEQRTGFDIVPVYYGTDRAEASTEKRLDYGPNRGRKLILGQALVTVPKSHVQPSVERPWAIRIPYFDITLYEEAEDPDKHFTMKELKAQTREELLALVRARLAKSERFKDHALVFIHGYNTTFDNGIYRTAQIAYDLKFDGAPFHYSWPSGGGLSSYTYDRESAGQSIPYMRDFFDLVIKESGAKKISVIAHSMGNQPALQVMRDIKASSPPGVVISQIILAAPDVDRDNFENIAKEIQGLANGITLYAASNDFALNASRRFHGGIPRAGDVPPGGPLVLPGIDTIDVTAVSTDSLGLNHSGYAENNALLNDLQLLIQTGERPPEKRIPLLEKIGTAAGDYWRYPTAP
ncbi:MAG: alpha/beta hydrolase [Hyphomicrobium sp.]